MQEAVIPDIRTSEDTTEDISNNSEIVISEDNSDDTNDNNNSNQENVNNDDNQEDNNFITSLVNMVEKICPDGCEINMDGGEEAFKSLCDIFGEAGESTEGIGFRDFFKGFTGEFIERVDLNKIRSAAEKIQSQAIPEPEPSIERLEIDWQDEFINAVCNGQINVHRLSGIKCLYCSLSQLEKAAFLHSNIEDINSFIALQENIKFREEIEILQRSIEEKDDYISTIELKNDELQDAVNDLTIELVNCRRS